MADLPSAETVIEQTAGRPSTGVDLCVVMAACRLNADIVPRLFANHDAILTQHGYCDGVDYAAIHIEETKKSVMFIGLPIVTEGVVGRFNSSGNSGSSVVSVAADPGGCVGEHDGVITVVRGGTVGTDQIMLGLSLDGGRTVKNVRMGTGNSYAIPHIRATISLGAGTLVAGDTVLTWHGTAPLPDAAGITAARVALAAQMKLARSWMLIGDLQEEDDASDFLTELNAYETVSDRFVYGRAQVRDRLPFATMSRVQVRMTGNPNVTFAEVGATGDTITRSAGSFVTDGFVTGMRIAVSGSASNNFTNALITNVTATVLTLDTQDLAAEGPVANVTITGTPGLTFAEVGATGDTITRAGGGSFLADGFRAGDRITVSGTVSNNFSNALVTTVTATVLTLDTQDLVAEGIGSFSVTLTAGETKAQHMATMDAEFADVDAEHRIDLGFGRGRKLSPILKYRFRRPVQWAASVREYQHDVHIPCWRKDDGPLLGWDLEDTSGTLVEHDDRVDGGACEARFTAFRTYSNGPAGAFIALSLTRDEDNTVLSRTHNVAVANIACTTNQAETENAIGQVVFELNADGTATPDSLAAIKGRVDSALAQELLQNKKNEGKRCDSVSWDPSTTDNLKIVPATLTGVLNLELNGTIEQIRTKVRINAAAAA